MKTQERQATIGEALTLGEVPTYGEIAIIFTLPFAVMFTIMGFTHSDKMGMMGVIALVISAVLAAIGVRLFYKRCKEALNNDY
jgi:ABC-type protease/lipase transport system fused ATPase/permease subunit